MPLGRSDCLFIHIPKCAGTSVEVALGVADDYPDIGLKPTSTQPHLASLFGGGLQHLTIREINKNYPEVAARKGLFSFSIIRDPVDRFVSHFIWKHYRFSHVPLDNADLLNAFLKETDDLVGLSHTLDVFWEPFDGFEYCQGDTQTFPPDDLGRHLLPQCAYIFDHGTVPIDAIYPMPNIKILERDLKQRGALVNPISYRMVGKASKQLRQIIPASAERKIQEVYFHDMRLNAHAHEVAKRLHKGLCPGRTIDAIRPTGGAAAKADRRTKIVQFSLDFPRQLWMYWHQGWEAAPMIVQKCLESWRKRNPSWQINLLNAETLHNAVRLPEFYAQSIDLPLPALSDVIRVNILAQHGGVWADATTWCARPLDEWLEYVVARSGFFAYAKPAPNRPFSSWFIAATRGHQIIDRLKIATDDLWRQNVDDIVVTYPTDDPESENYFWFHELFRGLLQTDPTIAALWEKVPQISAEAPHYLLNFGLTKPTTGDVEFHIHNKISNVYKLNRRIDLSNRVEGTVFDSLLKTL